VLAPARPDQEDLEVRHEAFAFLPLPPPARAGATIHARHPLHRSLAAARPLFARCSR
jgi:hypothetical protein